MKLSEEDIRILKVEDVRDLTYDEFMRLNELQAKGRKGGALAKAMKKHGIPRYSQGGVAVKNYVNPVTVVDNRKKK